MSSSLNSQWLSIYRGGQFIRMDIRRPVEELISVYRS